MPNLTTNLGKLSNMITSTGSNVGINGTPTSFSTNVYFDVIGNTTLQGGLIQSRNSDNSIIGSFFTNANGLNVRTETSQSLLFGTAATERMRITSAGLVGIGTSSPANSLDVVKNAVNSVRIQNTLNNADSYLITQNTGGSAFFGINETGPYIYTQTALATQFYTNNLERMRITSAGNVGIGTSSPTGQLSIANQISNGSNPVSSYAATSGVNGQNFFNGYYAVNSDGLGTFPRYLDIVSVGSPDGSNGGSNIRFFTNPIATSSPAVERMRISSSGAITTPSQPSFRAYSSINGFWNLNTGDVFIFNLTEYNIGGCYNTSNGRFTAPVAGVYQFNFYTIIYGAVTNGGISFRKNGGFPASGYNVHFSPTQAGAWSNVVYTTSIYLSAGDYVNVLNIGPYTQFHGQDWSSFSGYLVG